MFRQSSGGYASGVRDGVDFENTGVVRRIDVDGINDHLNDGSIVLLSPMGYSSTGEVFNLSHEDVATKAAIALKADKLILFNHQDGIVSEEGRLLRNLELDELYAMLDKPFYASEKQSLQAIVIYPRWRRLTCFPNILRTATSSQH